MKAIIMAGGSGKRFWPKSRKLIPKQCLKIASSKPMIEETVDILRNLTPEIYIATGRHLEEILSKILPDLDYIIEPLPKNTAACIGLAAIAIDEPDEILVFETSDHFYSDIPSYLEHIKAGIEIAKENKICLIGITPTFPHTGYGYIEQARLIKDGRVKIYNINSFKEKPDLETAKQFVAKANFLWNAGIFICKQKVILEAIKEHMPKLYSALLRIKESSFDKKILESEFHNLESIPIDKGVIEKSKNTLVVKANFPWEDIGDWLSLERILPKDRSKNVIIGKYSGNAGDSIIFGDEKPIEARGVSNIIIVDTKDCLLVCDKSRAQDVKKIVEMLEKDRALIKYADNIQEKYEPHQLLVDCKNVKISSKGIVAALGISDISIQKADKVIISRIKAKQPF
jgi:mannose-1-phosphate guanylyltransferase